MDGWQMVKMKQFIFLSGGPVYSGPHFYYSKLFEKVNWSNMTKEPLYFLSAYTKFKRGEQL